MIDAFTWGVIASQQIISVAPSGIDRLVIAAGQTLGLDMANLNSIVIRF